MIICPVTAPCHLGSPSKGRKERKIEEREEGREVSLVLKKWPMMTLKATQIPTSPSSTGTELLANIPSLEQLTCKCV